MTPLVKFGSTQHKSRDERNAGIGIASMLVFWPLRQLCYCVNAACTAVWHSDHVNSLQNADRTAIAP